MRRTRWLLKSATLKRSVRQRRKSTGQFRQCSQRRNPISRSSYVEAVLRAMEMSAKLSSKRVRRRLVNSVTVRNLRGASVIECSD